MRKTNIGGGNFTAYYPEANTFAGDKNIVFVTDNRTSPSGFEVSISIAGRTITYFSETTSLAIRIDELLALAGYDQELTLAGIVRAPGELSFGGSITHHRGVTLASRTHGSCNVIQLEALEDKFQLYSHYDGVEVIMDDTSIEMEQGLNDIDFEGRGRDYCVLKDSEAGYLVGEYTSLAHVNNRVIRLLPPPCEDLVFIEYYDTDGARRVAYGKMMDATTEITSTEYNATDIDTLKSTPARAVDGKTETMRLGFADVPAGQYLEDILLSTSVRYRSLDPSAATDYVYRDIVPLTMSSTRSGEAMKDFIFTFKLSR